jgi:4-hydroxybenzoate polyprenyltransferase
MRTLNLRTQLRRRDKSRKSKLIAILQIFRFEYIYATLPGMTITFFLCARSPWNFLSTRVVEGLAIIALMIFAGLGINSVIDRHIDCKYATFKNRIPEAIEFVGRRETWAIIFVQTAIAALLAVHIALGSGTRSSFVLFLFAAEAFFSYGYSIPPLQFKLRGLLWHGVSLMLFTVIIPFVLSAYTYLGNIPISLLTFIVGFALVQYGFEFSNQALDYLEDRREELRTPAVRLGVVGSIRASLVVPLVGMVICFGGLYWQIVERWRTIHQGHLLWSMHLTWAVAVSVMLVGYFVPMRNIWRMYILCRVESPEQCVPKLPPLCHYAFWQASSVSGTAAAAAIFFVASNYLW